MKLTTIIVILAVVLNFTFAKRCYATGDPHYQTLNGVKYDVYNTQGNYYLSQAPDLGFEIQSEMFFYPTWPNRGVQWGTVIKMDGVIIESDAGKDTPDVRKTLTVNGQALTNLPNGRKTTTIGGVKIKTHGSSSRFNVDIESTKTPGLIVELDLIRHGSKFAYHNIYVNMPDAIASKFTGGFCAVTNRIRNPLPASLVDKSKVPQALSLFKKHYNPANHVAHRVDKAVWKSDVFKNQAYDLCSKTYGLEGSMLKNCAHDIQSGGKLEDGEAYAHVKKDIAELMAEAKRNGKTQLHSIHSLIQNMLLKLKDEKFKAEDVLKKLEEELATLKKDNALVVQLLALAKQLSIDASALLGTLGPLGKDVSEGITKLETGVTEQKDVLKKIGEEETGLVKTKEFIKKYLTDQGKW